MPLSTADQELLEVMKQREFNLKRKQRAANAIFHETRRYRRLLLAAVAVAVGVILACAFLAAASTFQDWPESWHAALLVLIIGLVLGAFVGQSWLRTPTGRNLLANKEVRLNQKYSGDLHAGRRWQQFYYQREDISAYIPQILYVIESERRFDSVDEALAFVKDHSRESTTFRSRGLEMFNTIAAQTNLIILASTDETGRPSSRFMRFVKTDRPGVWYVTTAPDAPKVHELDRGLLSLITSPTASGATISSNRVRVRRANTTFMAVTDLYRTQVPGYLDGMTEDDQRRELVYELRLESAKIDTWLDHEAVVFDELDGLE